MNRSSHWGLAVALAFAIAVPHVTAQVKTKSEPRLPPNAAEAARIPAGVDSGTPATSDTQQLGTPVPPNLIGDRNEQKTRSAAARAAARPKSTSSSASCTKKVGPTAASGPNRIDC